jgi:hypothetical protein
MFTLYDCNDCIYLHVSLRRLCTGHFIADIIWCSFMIPFDIFNTISVLNIYLDVKCRGAVVILVVVVL